METALQQLAREITIMRACGGPLSRLNWMKRIATALADVPYLEGEDLERLATGFGGSTSRAQQFIRGLEVSCASFVAHPTAIIWSANSRTRARLEEALDMLCALCDPTTPPAGALST